MSRSPILRLGISLPTFGDPAVRHFAERVLDVLRRWNGDTGKDRLITYSEAENLVAGVGKLQLPASAVRVTKNFVVDTASSEIGLTNGINHLSAPSNASAVLLYFKVGLRATGAASSPGGTLSVDIGVYHDYPTYGTTQLLWQSRFGAFEPAGVAGNTDISNMTGTAVATVDSQGKYAINVKSWESASPNSQGSSTSPHSVYAGLLGYWVNV